MPHVVADRVLEASTSSGTGPFTLSGAVLGFRAFSAVCAVSDTVPYFIEAVDDQGRPTGDWEFGLGTYSAANQLTRTTIRGSSNGGLAVAFPAGTKLVGLGVPAPNSSTTRAEWRASLGFTPFGESLVTAASAAVLQALLPVQQPRVDVASAANVNLTASAPNTDHVNITGTTAITGFTVAAGRLIFARFAASLTLTNGAGLVTQTGANITTQAGDTCLLRATAANVVEVLCYVSALPLILGVGQTWQSLTGSRSLGVTYTNTTARPILVNVGTSASNTNNATLSVNIAGSGAIVFAQQSHGGSSTFANPNGSFIVPPGATYVVTASAGSLAFWSELR